MFTVTERQIYRWNDGTQDHWADPVATYRKLIKTPELNLAADLQAFANDPDSKAGAAALEHMVEAGRMAFDAKPYDGKEGLLDAEVIGLVMDFLSYLHTLKKKVESTPTSPPPTVPQSSDKSTTKATVAFI